MPKELWPQKSSALLDIPTNQYGALEGDPGQVLVINANRDGLEFAPAGTGGTAGPAGPANSLAIGTVQTGEEASAVITGLSPNQTLNLVLPKGDPGANGAASTVPGPVGPEGPQGAGLVPDGFGDLTDDFIAATELAATTLVYVVNPAGDLRANQFTPAGLDGNQSLKIIGYTVAGGWKSYGQFTGIQGPRGIDGPVGPQGPIGPEGPKGDPGLNGINGTTPDVSDKLTKSGDKTTGVIVFGKGIKESAVSMTAVNIDLAAGSVHTKTIAADATLTVSNASLVSGEVDSFILELTNGGAAIVSWWAGVTWAGGLAPELTAAGTDSIGFMKIVGGSWRGFLLAGDIK